MPPSATSDWRGKAGGFLSSSSVKLRQATQVAGDAAKNAGTSVAGAAERASSAVRTRWSMLQVNQQGQDSSFAQDRTVGQDRQTVQERWRTASTNLKRGLQDTKEYATLGFLDTKGKVAVGLVETKEKLAVGKVKVEEAAKKAAQRSKILIAEWRQKGAAGRGVFGVPLEVLVQRQKSSQQIPSVVTKCVDYLMLSGLYAEYIFKKDGNHRIVDRLILTLNDDPSASFQGANAVDVAALLKVFFQMLPEPLLMYENYNSIVGAHGNAVRLREIIFTLPLAHRATLECLSGLLLKISQKSPVNKMDSHSLAFEFAPVLLWQEGRNKSLSGKSRPLAAGSLRLSRLTPVIERPREEAAAMSEHQQPRIPLRVDVENAAASTEWTDVQGANDGQAFNGHNVGEEANGDLSAQIPLDDDEPLSVDFAIVETVQCLIDQHDFIFEGSLESSTEDAVKT